MTPTESVRAFFDVTVPGFLAASPNVGPLTSCTITLPGAGTWSLGTQPSIASATLTAGDFVELRQTWAAELESLVRSGRLKLGGDEPHAVRVMAMLARARVAPIDGPDQAFDVCQGAFSGPKMAFMRAVERDLAKAFPGYRRRLATPRRRPQRDPFTGEATMVEDDDPGSGCAWYRPIEPPLPFASVEILDGPNGEGIVELLLQITSTSFGEEHDHYGDMFSARFPEGLFGGRALGILEVPDELMVRASLLGAERRSEVVRSLVESGLFISAARAELEAAVDAVCNLSQAAVKADERLWLWCSDI